MKKTINVKVIDKLGLHARPASIICASAGKFSCSIIAKFNKHTANVKSILNLMSLTLGCDDEFSIVFDGADAKEASVAVVTAFEKSKVAKHLK